MAKGKSNGSCATDKKDMMMDKKEMMDKRPMPKRKMKGKR